MADAALYTCIVNMESLVMVDLHICIYPVEQLIQDRIMKGCITDSRSNFIGSQFSQSGCFP